MKINPKIFKAYDIRGLYPSEINEDVIYLIGQCFIRFLEKEQKISPNKKIKKLKIVIGRDNRLSSQFLFEKLSESLTKSGADVVDIGLSTTPMLYWACAHYKFDGGLMITASHLGKEYNGLKLVRENSIPISEKTGLKDILRCIQRLVKGGIRQNKKNKQGNVEKKDVLDDYLNFNFNGFNISSIKSIKIVIDTANAVPGILIPGLKKALPITIYHLFNKLDGNFPNHSPDPIIKENLYFLQKEVKNKKADLGVAFDGDGDRIVFLDEKGNMIPGDLITALLATLILKKEPGQLILYDIRSSNSVRDAIKENGGEPVMSRIGHSFIKEEMRKKNIFFGGEFSGHYYAKNHYFSEAPLFVLLSILEVISKNKKKLSSIIKPLKRYYHSGEINFETNKKDEILKVLEKEYKDGEKTKIDGLRIDFNDWWFLARPSATENLLRLVVEAKTKKLMEDKVKELSALIKKIGQSPFSF